jgi:glycosyltransferase involved in cell wall biosynthesis
MPNLRVTILGAGKFVDAVREAAAKDSRIAYEGLVTHEEVLRAYEDADLLLNLRRTHFETQRYVFPSKVIDCLSTGRPLLSTATGHIESEFGEFVFLLREETPNGLAAKLQEIAGISSELRRERAARARQFILEHKTWEAQARKFHAYLREREVPRCA